MTQFVFFLNLNLEMTKKEGQICKCKDDIHETRKYFNRAKHAKNGKEVKLSGIFDEVQS